MSARSAADTAHTPLTAAPAGHRAQRAAKPRVATSRPQPFVTTITRIVGVIPPEVWALVGALALLALAFAARSRLVVLRARRLERQRTQLLADVGLLQAALLPVPPAQLGEVGTSVAYRPADGPAAGGDFYDVFELEDGSLAVIVGDVSGHGRAALPHTALVRFTLRAYLEAGLPPREAVRTAGAALEHQLGDLLATAVLAVYEPHSRTLTYACAGHPPPVVPAPASIAPFESCSAPPLGAGMPTGTRQTIVSVPGATRICFHTDGVTEARIGSELYGAERLARAIAALGPRADASALLARVARETDARPDDMAACVLAIDGPVAAPTVLVQELELDRAGASDPAGGDRAARFLLACGVAPGDVQELARSARACAQHAGRALLRVRLEGGSPRVEVLPHNVAPLHSARVKQVAGTRGGRR